MFVWRKILARGLKRLATPALHLWRIRHGLVEELALCIKSLATPGLERLLHSQKVSYSISLPNKKWCLQLFDAQHKRKGGKNGSLVVTPLKKSFTSQHVVRLNNILVAVVDTSFDVKNKIVTRRALIKHSMRLRIHMKKEILVISSFNF